MNGVHVFLTIVYILHSIMQYAYIDKLRINSVCFSKIDKSGKYSYTMVVPSQLEVSISVCVITGCERYWSPIFKIVSCINHLSDPDKIFTVYPPLHLLLSTSIHLPARLKGPRQKSQRGDIVKIIRAVWGKMENKKSKGYENCSTEHELILTHFSENLNFFDKTTLHWNSFTHPQQKPASRDGGLASWLSW